LLREVGWTLLALGLTLAGCGGGDPQARDIGDSGLLRRPQTVPQTVRSAHHVGFSLGFTFGIARRRPAK
jgi:hypothetical protein